MVEDKAADEMELARARKEGGPGWNEVEPRRLVRQYPPEVAGEEIRIGFEPSAPPVKSPKTLHATQGDPEGPKFTIGDDGDEDEGLGEEVGQGDRPDTPREGYKDIEDSPWKRPEDNDDDEAGNDSDGGYPAVYGSMNERNVWG